jgi:hypothetical protein
VTNIKVKPSMPRKWNAADREIAMRATGAKPKFRLKYCLRIGGFCEEEFTASESQEPWKERAKIEPIMPRALRQAHVKAKPAAAGRSSQRG